MKIVHDYGSGIYRIRNLVNDHCYIGSAKRIFFRQADHLHRLRHNYHHSIYLQRAWNAHGASQFVFEVLEHVSIPKDLVPREQYWMDTLKPSYNICKTAGSPLGRKLNEEQLRAMSIRMSGKNSPNYGKKFSMARRKRMSKIQKAIVNPDHLLRMREAMAKKAAIHGWPCPMLGRHHTREAKKKFSRLNSGRGNPFYGKKHSTKTVQFLREKALDQIRRNGGRGLRTGAKLSEATKFRISQAHMGKRGPVISAEARERLSKMRMGNKHPLGCRRSKETRERMSIGQKTRWHLLRMAA